VTGVIEVRESGLALGGLTPLAPDAPLRHGQVEMRKRTRLNTPAGDGRSAKATQEPHHRSLEGDHYVGPGTQGPNIGYWQAVGSSRAAAKRSKRP